MKQILAPLKAIKKFFLNAFSTIGKFIKGILKKDENVARFESIL